MSWQSYVDTNLVGTGNVTSAAIVGLKGGVWAASTGFTVSRLSRRQDMAARLLERGPLQLARCTFEATLS